MALVACGDDSSSASPDETPVSSSEETVLSSSSNAAEEESDRIEAQCTHEDTKIGDVCSIVSGGDVSAGIMPNILNCYVYTEEEWVSKASGSPYGSSCEELVNAPADSTETPADSTAAED
ncbi:hypothetical protein SAMN05720762_10550 [Fibrobacter sp. UWH4]|nr:hypothetical protein SAMN05720762_10550 [Fibrobacter sp. UWH4]